MTSQTVARRLTVGTTVPLVLTLAVLAELTLQTVPLGKFAFRALEALANPDRTGGPFLPGRRYENARSYGDLAALGNLRSRRQYRKETFTTDRWGYRNSDIGIPSRPAGILLGDSFGVAPGVEDTETFSAQLARGWGRGVYNAAGMFRMNDPARFRAVARRLAMRGGVVIHEFLERQETPSVPVLRRRRPVPAPTETASQKFAAAWRERWTTCRLRILAERVYRVAQNDRFLPNPHRDNVAVGRLINGEEILFLPGDVTAWSIRRPINTEYWRWTRDELAKDGLRLVVLLVPNKYTVYGPLLDPPASDDAPGAEHLERLEAALRTAGIDVVNLKTVFRILARRGLEEGTYLYWLDDTHWTAEGMRIAAEEFVKAIPNRRSAKVSTGFFLASASSPALP